METIDDSCSIVGMPEPSRCLDRYRLFRGLKAHDPEELRRTADRVRGKVDVPDADLRGLLCKAQQLAPLTERPLRPTALSDIAEKYCQSPRCRAEIEFDRGSSNCGKGFNTRAFPARHRGNVRGVRF